MNEFKDETAQNQDDFELEITDLPPSGKGHEVLANLATWRLRFTSTWQSPRFSEKCAQNPPEDEGFELEITDLSGDIKPRVPMRWLNAKARLSPHVLVRQVCTVGGVLVMLGVLLFGNFPLLRSHVAGLFTATTPMATPSPSVPFAHGYTVSSGSSEIIVDVQAAPGNTASHLDSVPACLEVSPLQSSAAPLSKGLGESPLWVTGFTGPSATLNHLTRAKQSFLGWYQEIKLILDATYDGNILIQGGAQDGGALLWFGASADQEWTNTVTVNPRQPVIPGQLSKDGQHVTLTVSVYVPRAGCYFLQADWAGGSWMGYFAAGK